MSNLNENKTGLSRRKFLGTTYIDCLRSRALHAAAKKHGVCTQMENTGHAAEEARLTNEYIRSGAIGEVSEVFCRTNRPSWPQDIVRPAEEPVPETKKW